MEAIKKPTRTENTLSVKSASCWNQWISVLQSENLQQKSSNSIFCFVTYFNKLFLKKKDSIYYMTGTSDAYSVQFQASAARCGFAGG